MGRDAFFPNQRPAETSRGPCPLPIHYRDGSLIALFWRVDAHLANGLFRGSPFQPLLIGRKGVALLVAFEYRDTSIGAYNEIGLAVWAQVRGAKTSALGLLSDVRRQEQQGVFIIHLPVTTEDALCAGRELWGYPKYATSIRTRFLPGRAEATLEGEFDLHVPRRTGISFKGMPFVTLSVLGGRILRTVVEVDHQARWSLATGSGLRVLGDGPTSRSIQRLGLDRTRPCLTFRTDRMRSFLPPGKDLGSAEERRP